MRHSSPGPLLSLGVGSHGRVPPPQGPYSLLSRVKGHHLLPDTLTGLPVTLQPALTLRAETVAKSMSGELAIILWAARTPVGDRNRAPSPRPVPVSPLHISKENRNPATQSRGATPA